MIYVVFFSWAGSSLRGERQTNFEETRTVRGREGERDREGRTETHMQILDCFMNIVISETQYLPNDDLATIIIIIIFLIPLRAFPLSYFRIVFHGSHSCGRVSFPSHSLSAPLGDYLTSPYVNCWWPWYDLGNRSVHLSRGRETRTDASVNVKGRTHLSVPLSDYLIM